ncbi:hypothetical protein AB0H77_31490 [Streptomyces sp. NPDC050844]|uniref:hypothetical protein n=1 Tax=Streptomyces sp. NPDC050844 TaxID=3155790 RepID=UPI0033DEE2B8
MAGADLAERVRAGNVPAPQARRVVRGYEDEAERRAKQQRLQTLQTLQGRLRRALRERESGEVRITRGGQQWAAQRLFLTADGEGGAPFGNYTISVDPADGTVTMVLPEPLRKRHANAPRGRYVLDARAVFTHQAELWRDRASSAASVRYDIHFTPARQRWYVDASWSLVKKGHKLPAVPLQTLRRHPVVAVDVNADHLAAWVLDACGNPVGRPQTIPLDLAGLSASTRDARLREAVTRLIHLAEQHGCAALVIKEDHRSDRGNRASRLSCGLR